MNEFTTGTIIKSRRNSIPLIVHYGIIANIDGVCYVLHYPIGSTPVIDTIDNFFLNRYLDEIIGVLNVDANYLFRKFDQLKDVRFDLVDANCEDFVNDVVGETVVKGGKRDLFVGVATCLLFLIK